MRAAVDSALNVFGVIGWASWRRINSDAATITALMRAVKRSVNVRSRAGLGELPATVFRIINGRLDFFIGMSVGHNDCSILLYLRLGGSRGASPAAKCQSPATSHIQIAHIQGVLLDEFSAGFDLVAHDTVVRTAFQNRRWKKCQSLVNARLMPRRRMTANDTRSTMPASPGFPPSNSSQPRFQSSSVAWISPFCSESVIRSCVTFGRRWVRATALPHSSRTCVVVTRFDRSWRIRAWASSAGVCH